jgi:hypothetical protein
MALLSSDEQFRQEYLVSKRLGKYYQQNLLEASTGMIDTGKLVCFNESHILMAKGYIRFSENLYKPKNKNV